MNWLDYAILIILAIFIYRGFRKGFLAKVLGVVGVILGIWLGVRHNLKIAQILKDIGIPSEISPYLAMFLIFLGCITIASLIARFLRNISVFIELVDDILGATLGLLEGLLIVGVLLIFLGSLNFPPESVQRASKLYKPVTKTTVFIYDLIEKNLGSKVKFKERIQKTIESIKGAQRNIK